MHKVRRHLARVVLGWLLLQSAGVAVPFALTVAGTLAVEEICTCPAAAHDTSCPMHKPDKPASSRDGRCAMRSDSAPTGEALLSLIGRMAVMPRAEVFGAPTVQTAIRLEERQFVSRTEVPDPPPPRA
jgi:hypothetical protein